MHDVVESLDFSISLLFYLFESDLRLNVDEPNRYNYKLEVFHSCSIQIQGKMIIH